VITNHKQYQFTQEQAQRFREALGAPVSPSLHPVAAKAIREGFESQLSDLESEMRDFEAKEEDSAKIIEVPLLGIGEAFVEVRTIRNMSQQQLASHLSLSLTALQECEATHYRYKSLEFLQEVADALGVRVHETITLIGRTINA
jgi:DNA-binding transcriptional regulator YiaG